MATIFKKRMDFDNKNPHYLAHEEGALVGTRLCIATADKPVGWKMYSVLANSYVQDIYDWEIISEAEWREAIAPILSAINFTADAAIL